MASTKKRMLEIKSFADESSYNLILSGHSATLLYVAHLVPIRNDLDRIIQTAREGYMPTQFYDDAGSSVRMFSNDYARIMHMTKRRKARKLRFSFRGRSLNEDERPSKVKSMPILDNKS
ncbi:hypothetical protein CAPTEDRAFT_189746 [Capitella teleta]|uniref:Uncharacterized protein n=1 Tax=Capitella teleta TaxID=283909 RepID=R7UAE9_CAPTE|nr:hypothetical protein CAPTEDRAFT_189746 [Capitella teleta]|eukprot:ELU00121.1 hypothetical protein CAPTEDRAFT_189746 [Capitella teleta]